MNKTLDLDYAGRYNDLVVIVGLLLFVILLRPILRYDFILGYGSLASSILIWMIFALAFNLLLGYTGLLSFGHAAFLGTGMYVTAIVTSNVSTSYFIVGAIGALVVVTVTANLIARLIVDKGEIYFAMLTIAFGEIYWYVANTNPWGLTGGSNGISQGILPGWIETELGRSYLVAAGVQIEFYWVVSTAFIFLTYVIFRIVRSPFGKTLVAIRENEELARSVGVNTERYKQYVFTLSAFFSGIAGVLLVIVNQGVTTNSLHWSTSGQIVIMSVLGGIGTFIGPMVGSLLWQVGSEILVSFEVLALPFQQYPLVEVDLSDYLDHWRFLFGLMFVLVVMLKPEAGIWGLCKSALRRVTRGGEDR